MTKPHHALLSIFDAEGNLIETAEFRPEVGSPLVITRDEHLTHADSLPMSYHTRGRSLMRPSYDLLFHIRCAKSLVRIHKTPLL